MRLETIPEVSEITWVCPGAPFLFDVDAVADDIPEGMAFGVGIAEEFKQIFQAFHAESAFPLQVIDIEDGKKLTIEIPSVLTEQFRGRKKLMWIIYEIRDGKPYPLLKGPIRLDGGDYFKGFET